MSSFGLVNADNGTEVPLKSIGISVLIQGFVAEVQATLSYENEETCPIEARFTFPMDEGSAVYKFEAEIEDRLVVGECQEKQQAQQTYDDALAAGRSAFLMKESDASSDVFECSVGNLPPHTAAVIRFAYVLELTMEGDGAVKFTYPAVLNQRYGSPSKPLLGSTSSHDNRRSGCKAPALHHTAADDLPYSVTFQAEVKASHRIIKIEPESTEDALVVHFTRDKMQADVTLRDGYSLDHDLSLLVWYSKHQDPHVIHEKGDPDAVGYMNKDVVMLNFFPKDVPKPAGKHTKGEYIFVVDRSGSMGGDRIASARAALGRFLDGLPQDCYFNIVSFGSTFEVLFSDKSRTVAPNSLKVAKNSQASMAADMGGTQMMDPFKHIYEQLPQLPGYPRQIFLLTDGGMWRTEDLIQLVKKNSRTTRVFTFGIGHGASTELVKGVARAGRGRHQFITDDLNRLPIKVAQVLHWAMQPSVDDVALEYNKPDEVSIMHLPQTIPPLFEDECLIVYAILSGLDKCSARSTIKVTLKGSVMGNKFSSVMSIDPTGGSTGGSRLMIHRLAAKAQIKDLEDDNSTEVPGGMTKKDKIILLSTCANVVSQHTAFVGVDKERTDKIEGEMEKRDVPLAKEKKGKKRKSRSVSKRSKRSRNRSRSRSRSRSRNSSRSSSPAASSSTGPRTTQNVYYAPKKVQASSMPRLTGGGSSTSSVAERYLSGRTPSSIPQPITSVLRSKSTITAALPVNLHKFAQRDDDRYYPVVETGYDQGKTVVKFTNGRKAAVDGDSLLSTLQLSAGDVIGVKDGRHGYMWSLILEYHVDTDEIIVARRDGRVSMLKPSHFMIPQETAQKMKQRKTGSFQPIKVCEFRGQQGMITMTTADLSELRADGWLTERLVEYWLLDYWASLSQQHRAHTVYFSPWFFKQLADELNWGKRYTRNSEHVERLANASEWIGKVEISQTNAIFIPAFEDNSHWFLILVKITADATPKRYKAQFIIMDSYFAEDRTVETINIKRFLLAEAAQQSVELVFESRVRQARVPVQSNESDCGVCMLQCINQTCKENLEPRPHLEWFDDSSLCLLRQELGKSIMAAWNKETTSDCHREDVCLIM